ncbi:thiosulfate sulfurtransferase GlpE [Lonepinella sp. BR2357]|uniref:thiosulfate sulfurtransferase GlpE n=1 Tax=Lonepinella sp. BR2357 TaxID=3434549 RepID=UPI003F6E2F3E
MTQLIDISPQQAWDMLQNQTCALLDVRDWANYSRSHIPDAFHLTNQSYGDFQNEYDYDEPVILVCYHGISSRSVGTYLIEQGYEQVYSVIGGFEAWEKAGLPTEQGVS